MFSEDSCGPRAEAQRVRAEMVVSRLCWIIVQGFSRRRMLMQSAFSRRATAEGDDGRDMMSREWTDENASVESDSSSGVSGPAGLFLLVKKLEW